MFSTNEPRLTTDKVALMTVSPVASIADASNFPEPPGTKVTANVGGPPKEIYPVLLWTDYIYWPLSYMDNRYSMAIVVTDSDVNIIKVVEARGARYIEEILVNDATREVSFIGQGQQVATLSWHHLFIAATTDHRALSKMPPHKAQPTATLANMTVDQALTDYTSPSKAKYTDKDFDRIAKLLQYSEALSKYSKSPRLYTLLRHLECLEELDRLLDTGLSDSSLPLSQTQLPPDLSEEWKLRFIAAQPLVCDDSDAVQMVGLGNHMTFSREPDCFWRMRFLGKGAHGEVDEVFCIGSFLARKRISRSSMSANQASAAAAFRNEVENMKRVTHRHCVQLVASYTDPSVFAFLMVPVAECNLRKYLQEGAKRQEKRSFLPNFFGCLSRGLWYIHRQKLQHRDIKPENILISDNKVLFTDFDSSYNWSHTMHSTAVGIPPRTREYASPEVARSGFDQYARVKSSSDIWSLGCVFLEIITVLTGRSEKELDHLRSSCYWTNLEGIQRWITELEGVDTQSSAKMLFECIKGMLREDPELRHTAHRLAEMTSDFCCLDCKADDSRRHL